MRRGSLILCSLTSVWLAHAQSGNPVGINVKADPRNYASATVIIENNSKFPLTALSLAVSSERFSVRGGVVRANGSSDVAPERPPLPVFDSAVHLGSGIKPGGRSKVILPIDPAGQVRVVAAVLADGETFGDPQQIQTLLARRRAMLQALSIVIRDFPTRAPPPGAVCVVPAVPGPQPRAAGDAGMNPMPGPGEDVAPGAPPRLAGPHLPPSLNDCIAIGHPDRGVPNFLPALTASLLEERTEVRDTALIDAILRVHFEVQRKALAMRGASPAKILAKLTAMLHAWQAELQSSLPSLSAAP